MTVVLKGDAEGLGCDALMDYRPFLNSDPPALCEIWRSQPDLRGRIPALSPTVFERLVLAKPYFDRRGLIVAVDQGRPIGFAHAGFGPAGDGASLDTESGSICQVMAAPREDQREVAGELVARCEAYLREKGARRFFGGGVGSRDPFYFGLYGGVEPPGVLDSDETALAIFRAAGYEEVGRRVILQRKLLGFRPPVDRRGMQFRRECRIVRAGDPRPRSWWEACLTTHMDRVGYQLQGISDGEVRGEALFWDMEPLAAHWGVHAQGLLELRVEPSAERDGVSLFLLGEAMKEMRTRHVMLVEAQADQTDRARLELLGALGFQEVEQGIVFAKPA